MSIGGIYIQKGHSQGNIMSFRYFISSGRGGGADLVTPMQLRGTTGGLGMISPE